MEALVSSFLALLVPSLQQEKGLAPSPGALLLLLKVEMWEQVGDLSKLVRF